MWKESETLELKKSLVQLNEGIISLGVMLNKRNKAELVFGINDSGEVVGVCIGAKTIADIGNEIRNSLKPYPQKIDVYERFFQKLLPSCCSLFRIRA